MSSISQEYDDAIDLTQDINEDIVQSNIDNDDIFDQLFPAVSNLKTTYSGVSSSSSATTNSVDSQLSTNHQSKRKCDSQKQRKKKAPFNTDKAEKKQKLLEEKQTRKVASEINKVFKPGECMKYMTLELHPTLLSSWHLADVEREVLLTGAKVCSSSELCDEHLATWTRTVQPSLHNDGGLIQLSSCKQRCEQYVYIVTAEELAGWVETHELSQHLGQVKEIVQGRLTLVAFGIKDYFKSTSRKTKSSQPRMTKVEMEMALADLLVSCRCDAALVNEPNELALLLAQFTKAVAEAPFKKAKHASDDCADFYMRGENKKCVPVDKHGNGVSGLWQQMIAVLPNSSLEVARAVCGEYGSPLALQEALLLPGGEASLAAVGVARSRVSAAAARRLGPEQARRLCALFTCDDGQQLLR